MGSTDLISQKRGWVITCHFNNVFYCLQALVVPSGSNGGFNAKWNRERRIERRGQRRRKVKADWAQAYDWFIRHDLLFLQFHALDCVEGLQGRPAVFQMDTKSGLLDKTLGISLDVARETNWLIWPLVEEKSTVLDNIPEKSGLLICRSKNKTWRLQWGCVQESE